jgi:hypothetical protein
MPKIYSLKEPFDLGKLRLANPVSKNGSHFIKSLAGEDPIYFLAPKCFIKQGFVPHGKKVFCDFVFSTEDSGFLSWMENLEEIVRTSLYTNREKWFETPLDEHDIESSLASPYKSYKSGKYFIVRANVPTALGKINIKIYDEQEKETDPENIKENTNVMVVLEFQGIRCSVRSFQFEIVLKQMLVVEPEKLFEKCIIPTSSLTYEDKSSTINSQNRTDLSAVVPDLNNTSFVKNSGREVVDIREATPQNTLEDLSSKVNGVVRDNECSTDVSTEVGPEVADIRESIAPNTFNNPLSNDANGLKPPPPIISPLIANEPVEVLDVDLVNADSDPPIQLKKRNDVYYKLYKEARTKAREAKQIALANYLEAKRIKNTYLLEDMSESDEEVPSLESETDEDYDE